jgi:trk system potassium uptake protein TrkH
LTGDRLEVLGLVRLLPMAVVYLYRGQYGDGWNTVLAFAVPAAIASGIGLVLRHAIKADGLDGVSSMLMCAVGWLVCSAIGALPLVFALECSYLDAYFEAMSGFTTTGITVFTGLDEMPRSILFWRSLTQWLGGLGILSFFLIITFGASSAHHLFGAESHKISSTRPAPGLFNTLTILWAIYAAFTVLAVVALVLARMPLFDAVCHAFTALSTGGFSPYDASIDYYRQSGHPNYRLIEYILTFFMMLGGINFLVHYRVLTGSFKALWDNIEIRYWWCLIAGITALVMIDHFRQSGAWAALWSDGTAIPPAEAERTFRYGVFQVIALMTTTGFGTMDIGSDFFGTASKQVFLVLMVIGGCVGSTGGGFKVLRIAMLNRLLLGELFKTNVSDRAVTGLIIDRQLVPDVEIHRVAGLFFGWIALLVIGGVITAFFSDQNVVASFSGMFSALGNIGPCYISIPDMIAMHPVVKVTYILGMLAGRLEILPVLLLFSPRSWR